MYMLGLRREVFLLHSCGLLRDGVHTGQGVDHGDLEGLQPVGGTRLMLVVALAVSNMRR